MPDFSIVHTPDYGLAGHPWLLIIKIGGDYTLLKLGKFFVIGLNTNSFILFMYG